MNFYFESIAKFSPFILAKALGLMLHQNEISKIDRILLNEKKLLPIVLAVRKIFRHPHPQNRIIVPGSIYRNPPREVRYQDAKGNYQWEPVGLLNLTPMNNNSAPPVTKPAVINYIRELILEERAKLIQDCRPEVKKLNRNSLC